MRRKYGLCLLLLVLLRLRSWAENGNQIDPTPCFNKMLETTSSMTSNIEFANSWLDLVDEDYYKGHEAEVNAAAEKTLSWKASGSWKEFDEERKKYHRLQSGTTSYKQSIQNVFNGITDRGLGTVDLCLKEIAAKQVGIFYAISKNTLKEVQLEIYWHSGPGANPEPFEILKSSLTGAHRLGIDANPGRQAQIMQRIGDAVFNRTLADPPRSGELFVRGVKIGPGDSKYTLRLMREDNTDSVTGSFEGKGFDQVFFNVPPPESDPDFVRTCSTNSAKLKGQSPAFYTVPFQGENFPLHCWHMRPGRTVVITVSGTILPPQFASYSAGVEVDNYKPGVTYDVMLDMIVRDAGDNIIDQPRVLDHVARNGVQYWAKDPVPVGISFTKLVPPSGAILVALTSPYSQKWPGRDGPVSLSDDFTITIQETDGSN